MKKILVSLVIGVALCVVGVNDTFAAAIELNSTPLISDANLVSYYRLENVNDSKGANNLTNNNTATFTAGKFNNAGTFVRASNQFLSNSDAANLRINTSQSWVAWINMASYPGGSQISQIAGICPVGLANYRLWDVYNKRLRIQLSGLSAGSTAGSDLSLNTWYHVAWVYDSAGSTLTLYINGVPETPVAVTGTLTTATGDFNIGKSGTGATDPFDGKIDDVAVFNRALTDAEISNLYNGTWNAPPTAFSLTAPASNTSTNNPKPTFSWQASTDPESVPVTYTLKLSTDQAFTETVYRTVSSLSGASYTPAVGQEITDGSYYWKVIASDGEMTTESTETWQVTVDTQVPIIPSLTEISSDPRTGRITKISGTGENGTTLTFYDQNNNPITGTTTWDGSGNFTFTPTTPLAPGSTVYVKSEDGAQNSSQSATNAINFECVKNVFKDDAIMHGDPPGSSMRMEKDTSYDFNIAVNNGVTPDPDKPVTVKAYVQYNTVYGSEAKPKITLSGLGIPGTETGQYAVATGTAENGWEQLTVTGTPNAKGVLTLKVETFSTVDGAKAWVDDISVSQ